MFIIFGLVAVVFAFLNVVRFSLGKSYKIFMFLSMSFTCLTLILSLYGMSSFKSVDLEDVFVTASTVLSVCTVFSIFINSIPLFHKKENLEK